MESLDLRFYDSIEIEFNLDIAGRRMRYFGEIKEDDREIITFGKLNSKGEGKSPENYSIDSIKSLRKMTGGIEYHFDAEGNLIQ